MTGRTDQAIDIAQDHLHTTATVPAGIAGDVADGRSADGGYTQRSNPPDVRPEPDTTGSTSRIKAIGRYLGAVGAASAVLAAAAAPPASAVVRIATERPLPNSIAVDDAAGALPALMPRTTTLAAIAATRDGDGLVAVGADGSVVTAGAAQFVGRPKRRSLPAPVVGVATAPDGAGYWLATADGRVKPFGSARFLGSLADTPHHGDVVGIAATPSGKGYWLAASDGGVFSFGDARFHGSASGRFAAPVVGIAARRDGRGYWLATRDGHVAAFGTASNRAGSLAGAGVHDVVAIAADHDGRGYYLARSRGDVIGFRTPAKALLQAVGSTEAPTVSVAARPGGFWAARGRASGADSNSPSPLGMHPFLVCTRAHESDTAGGYRAISPGGTYRGAYQFLRSTWDNVARHAGRPDLVGVDPAAASPADQDLLAWDLYQWQGAAPWGGRCA